MAIGATGTIFNIQRYSLHDGPGIRTTVFLKGCPLRCLWCHNPESQAPQPEVVYLESRCRGCGACVRVCPNGALGLTDQAGGQVAAGASLEVCGPRSEGSRGLLRVVADRARCSACGACVEACCAGARELTGKEVSATEVMEEILKDRVFYDQSGGGVTFSGGEPLMQPQFLRDLLERCREEGLATTVDTSGFAPWEVLEAIVPLVDVFLYDVKVMDDASHRRYVGAANRVILENLAGLAPLADSLRKTVLARIPLVPGINDDDENVRSTGKFLRGCGVRQVSVLPYHQLGGDKYRRLGREYSLPDVTPPSAEGLRRAAGILEGSGLLVKAGG